MFVDVHSHLDMVKKEGISIKEIQKKADEKKVKIVWAGVNPKVNRKILDESDFSGEICLGLYPIDALALSDSQIDEEIEFIKSNKDKIVGIGEVGIDHKEDSKEHDKQEKTFRKMVRLAKELDKVLVVHSRKAEEKCISVLEEEKAKKVIMHVFSGKLKLVGKIVENGWTLSIPTSVKNSEHFQKVVEMTPIEQLLCETDSPYLHPDREFPNTPDNVIASYEVIAKIKDLPIDEVEKHLEKNWVSLS
jgi:TatD DNase family protein